MDGEETLQTYKRVTPTTASISSLTEFPISDEKP